MTILIGVSGGFDFTPATKLLFLVVHTVLQIPCTGSRL